MPYQPKPFKDILWRKDMLIVVAFYTVFALFYYASIQLTTYSEDNYYTYQILVDYPLKGLITLPLWWLLFRHLRHWTLLSKIGLHVLAIGVFVKGWQLLYYYICDLLDLGHLGGKGEWWDIYITSLFYVLQFGIFHAYDYYRSLTATREEQLILQQHVLQSELTALKAQLNPHFLYNTFNTISASVPAAQEHTRELIATLSDLFRYQLKASKKEMVPLVEELTFVKKYLELEQARFGERLEVIFDISPAAKEVAVAPMLLQPLVENAIRHGISSLVEGGTIAISAKIEVEQLQIQVSDTGIGFDTGKAPHSNGIGLYNTRRRLKLRYNTDLKIATNHPRGTIISFQIPIHPSYAA